MGKIEPLFMLIIDRKKRDTFYVRYEKAKESHFLCSFRIGICACHIDFVYLVPRFPFFLFIYFLLRFRICHKIFMNE